MNSNDRSLTRSREKLADGNLAARNGARFHQFVVRPSAASDHFARRGPLDAEAAEIAFFEFSLEHAASRPREPTQAAHLAFNEVSRVADTVTNCCALAVQLSRAPLAAGRLRAVRRELDALTVLLMLRIQLADVAATAGQQQVGAVICAD